MKDYMAQLSATGTYQVSRPGEGEAAEAVRWLFLRRRGDQGRDRPHLSEVRLPHRPPHRRGLRRPGAVPERDGGQDPLHRGLHRQSLQVLRQRPQRLGEEEKQNRAGAAGRAERKDRDAPPPSRWHPSGTKEIRFTQTVEKDHMVDAVLGMLE